MKRSIILIAAASILAGCSTFKLGGLAYCPHGQSCEYRAGPPSAGVAAAPASAMAPASSASSPSR